MKALGIPGTFDNFQAQVALAGETFDPVGKLASLTSIDEDDLQPPKEQKKGLQELGSVAILNISGMHDHSEDQSKGINQNVSLSSHDLFACIKATLSGLANHFSAFHPSIPADLRVYSPPLPLCVREF